MAFGAVWQQVMEYGLRLGGVTVDLRVNYVPAAPLSAEEELSMALDKKALGLPLVQTLRESSYEPDQIEEITTLLADERDAAARQFSRGVAPLPAGERTA